MYHSDHDNEEAPRRRRSTCDASMYKDQLPKAGLFWAQLADRGRRCKSLNYAEAWRLPAEARRHALDDALWRTARPRSTGTT